jgi:hypothetical protein
MKDEKNISAKDLELLAWLKNFIVVFQEAAPKCDIKPAEVSALISLVGDVMNDLNLYRSADKRIERDALIRFVISFINRMKQNPNYAQKNWDEKLNTIKLKDIL